VLAVAASALILNGPINVNRRQCLTGLSGGGLLLNTALPVDAYDKLKSIDADFEALEKKRMQREAKMDENRKRLKPLLDKIASSTDAESFAEATDSLAFWLIGEGKLPEGLDAPGIRDTIQDAYKALPQRKFRCEPTRDNNGVCLSPGPLADDAYKVVLSELRKYATKPGKGSLMSDGVSAANSAAF